MASILKEAIEGQSLEASSSRDHAPSVERHDAGERLDLLRRFTPTPYAVELQLMHRAVRLESNDASVLDLAQKFFARHQHGTPGKPQFAWRIVCESDELVQSTDLPFTAFSDSGLRFVNIGQRGFLAIDLENREAVAFFSHRFLEGETRFRHRPPLDILFCMTAASLGLIALSGACVALEGRGVVIFGPPNSGKTTASYLAAKSGLEFHADQVVFLDLSGDGLRVWGDPFPAVFRPETLKFLPELAETSRNSTYADLSFFYFDKSDLQPSQSHAVTPVSTFFLDRGSEGETEIREIGRAEAVLRLRECMLFKEDTRFDALVTAAVTALAENPIYDLRYSADPRLAARVIEGRLR